jgi:arsenite methyltransferase
MNSDSQPTPESPALSALGTPHDASNLRDMVQKKYGEAALRVLSNEGSAVHGLTAAGGCCSSSEPDPITSDLYSKIEAGSLPEDALLASLGCGNPTALADLMPGEVVLDLGSGGGIDVLLSAKRVGPTGFAYGLDMTDEMLALAEKNKAEAGAENVQFLKGHIEEIPLADNSVDVIISNCVINLSGDKEKVIREALRVLRPGGRLAVSDVVVEGSLPPAIRRHMELYVGCVAGALEKDDYLRFLADAGFESASIQPTRVYDFSDLESCWASGQISGLTEEDKQGLSGRIYSAFIRAQKPGASSPSSSPTETQP